MRPGLPHPPFAALALLVLATGPWTAGCTRPNPAFLLTTDLDGGSDADAAELEDVAVDPPADSQPLLDLEGEGDLEGDAEVDVAPAPDSAEEEVTPAPDVATPVDLAPLDSTEAPPDLAPETSPDLRPPVACGTARPAISTITGGDGLAIGPDGTMYFTSDDGTHGWIGRMVGSTITSDWLRINYARATAGLALDRSGTKLYVASVSGEALLMFDLAANPVQGSTIIANAPGINDLATAPDGSTIYFSRQSDRHVYMVRAGVSAAVRVTITTIGVAAQDQGPAGLAFGPDGALYVGQRKGGNVIRLTLNGDGRESGRSNFGTFTGWANGLAFDLSGRLYVATYSDAVNTKVVRLAAGGGPATDIETGGQFASLAFGRGTLDCHDLYIALPSGAMRRRNVDVAGFYVAP